MHEDTEHARISTSYLHAFSVALLHADTPEGWVLRTVDWQWFQQLVGYLWWRSSRRPPSVQFYTLLILRRATLHWLRRCAHSTRRRPIHGRFRSRPQRLLLWCVPAGQLEVSVFTHAPQRINLPRQATSFRARWLCPSSSSSVTPASKP